METQQPTNETEAVPTLTYFEDVHENEVKAEEQTSLRHYFAQVKCESDGEDSPSGNIPDNNKPLVCKVCDFKPPHKSILIAHLKGHTGCKPTACNICDYFRSVQDNTENVTRKGPRKSDRRSKKSDKAPSKSDKSLTESDKSPIESDKNTGKSDESLSKSEKRFACSNGNCCYKCDSKSKLLLHMYTHAEKKPFMCKLCPKGYPSQHSLNRHIKIHSEEKPFACHICSHKTRERCDLNRHIKHCHKQ